MDFKGNINGDLRLIIFPKVFIIIPPRIMIKCFTGTWYIVRMTFNLL